MEEVGLHIQRVMDIVTRKWVYAEVLVRNYFGLKGASSIVNYGKAKEICKYIDMDIVKEAFKYISYLKEYGKFECAIGINLCATTISCEGISEAILKEAKHFDIDSEDYMIEVNESSVFDDNALKNISDFRSNGVKILLDDFGIGNSNIVPIVNGIVDIVKVDRTLIESVNTGSRKRKALECILEFCTKMGCDTIIEGVETDEELKTLRDIGFRNVQGYLLDMPKPIEYDFSALGEAIRYDVV